jgi:hypothetical protein
VSNHTTPKLKRKMVVRWRLPKMAYNGIGLGEGGLVGCSILAECFLPTFAKPVLWEVAVY